MNFIHNNLIIIYNEYIFKNLIQSFFLILLIIFLNYYYFPFHSNHIIYLFYFKHKYLKVYINL